MPDRIRFSAAVLCLAKRTKLRQTYPVPPATPVELPLLVSGK